LKKAGVDIEISCAAEYYMDDFFEELLEKGDILTLEDNHVLVEMSFFSEAFKLDEYLFKMQVKGYKPILAHPERYTYYLKKFDRLEDLKNRGFKLQLNLLSLTGHYGKEVKDLAIMILNKNLYDFVGTDTHNIGHIEKLKTLTSNKNKKATSIGNNFLNQTFLG
jgi:tyrosine-protein phosphatase YwqE